MLAKIINKRQFIQEILDFNTWNILIFYSNQIAIFFQLNQI